MFLVEPTVTQDSVLYTLTVLSDHQSNNTESVALTPTLGWGKKGESDEELYEKKPTYLAGSLVEFDHYRRNYVYVSTDDWR